MNPTLSSNPSVAPQTLQQKLHAMQARNPFRGRRGKHIDQMVGQAGCETFYKSEGDWWMQSGKRVPASLAECDRLGIKLPDAVTADLQAVEEARKTALATTRIVPTAGVVPGMAYQAGMQMAELLREIQNTPTQGVVMTG